MILFTYEAAKNPAWRSPLYRTFKDVTLVRVDDHTIQFQLPKANPLFLTDLTLGILPAHLWEDIPAGNAVLADLNLRPIGAGPYQASTFTRDSRGTILTYTLERFSQYHGIQPHINAWQFRFYADHSSAIQALKNNQIDTLAFLPWQAASDVKTEQINRTSFALKVLPFQYQRSALERPKTASILARAGDQTNYPTFSLRMRHLYKPHSLSSPRVARLPAFFRRSARCLNRPRMGR